MIKYDHIMIRFGELSTKGKNKKQFISLLGDNIKHSLRSFKNISIEVRYDHIYIALNDENYEPIISKLKDVSGIHAMSLVYKCNKDIEEICSSSLELIKGEEGKTFKVFAKRADKKFELHSDEIIRKIATVVLKNTDLKVDIHNPDIEISCEVRDDAAYIFAKTYLGAGGYPLGIGGKSMHMLSGGIDSPVAAFLLMKRGVKIECIHFASPPYTQQAVIYKLEDLLKQLNKYQASIRLNIVPFTKIQELIYDKIDESYCITMMRRMMFRLADRLARRRRCPVISSGESVGQVASQTLQSINVINRVTNMPVIRPCAVMDKLEIIDVSKKIGTYDISIRPYEDCCTIFTPKSPKTMPNAETVEFLETKLDFEPLIEEALNNIEVKYINEEDEEDLL